MTFGRYKTAFSFRKCLALTLCAVMLYEVAGMPLAEAAGYAQVWDQRRKSSSKGNVQLAGLPAPLAVSPKNLLDALPATGPANFRSDAAARSGVMSAGAPRALTDLVSAIPSTLATVRSAYAGHGGAPVLIVQDVHLNAEAQTNIAKVVRGLISEKNVRVIGVEGAFGNFDFSSFRGSPKETEALAKAFLDDSRIAAPSYLGLTLPAPLPKFIGVDDRAHYDANRSAYLSARGVQAATTATLTKIRSAIEKERAARLSADLQKIENARDAQNAGSLGLAAYVRQLTKFPIEPELPLEQFSRAAEIEGRLDFSRVDRERRTVVEKLAARLSTGDLQRLLEMSLAYRAGRMSFGGYYAQLRTMCESAGISLSTFPSFDEYIKYALLADGIDADALFESIRTAERDVVRLLVRNDADRALCDLSERLRLTEKLVQFGLTPSDWREYQRMKPTASGEKISADINVLPLAPFESFYGEADQRSRSIIDAMMKARKGEAPAILIAGGFHTPDLSRLLKERGIPHAIATPRLTHVDVAEASAYLSVFAREKTPLDRLFAGEKLFIAPEFEALGNPLARAAGTEGRFRAYQLGIAALGGRTGSVDVQVSNRGAEVTLGVTTEMDRRNPRVADSIVVGKTRFAITIAGAYGALARFAGFMASVGDIGAAAVLGVLRIFSRVPAPTRIAIAFAAVLFFPSMAMAGTGGFIEATGWSLLHVSIVIVAIVVLTALIYTMLRKERAEAKRTSRPSFQRIGGDDGFQELKPRILFAGHMAPAIVEIQSLSPVVDHQVEIHQPQIVNGASAGAQKVVVNPLGLADDIVFVGNPTLGGYNTGIDVAEHLFSDGGRLVLGEWLTNTGNDILTHGVEVPVSNNAPVQWKSPFFAGEPSRVIGEPAHLEIVDGQPRMAQKGQVMEEAILPGVYTVGVLPDTKQGVVTGIPLGTRAQVVAYDAAGKQLGQPQRYEAAESGSISIPLTPGTTRLEVNVGKRLGQAPIAVFSAEAEKTSAPVNESPIKNQPEESPLAGLTDNARAWDPVKLKWVKRGPGYDAGANGNPAVPVERKQSPLSAVTTPGENFEIQGAEQPQANAVPFVRRVGGILEAEVPLTATNVTVTGLTPGVDVTVITIDAAGRQSDPREFKSVGAELPVRIEAGTTNVILAVTRDGRRVDEPLPGLRLETGEVAPPRDQKKPASMSVVLPGSIGTRLFNTDTAIIDEVLDQTIAVSNPVSRPFLSGAHAVGVSDLRFNTSVVNLVFDSIGIGKTLHLKDIITLGNPMPVGVIPSAEPVIVDEHQNENPDNLDALFGPAVDHAVLPFSNTFVQGLHAESVANLLGNDAILPSANALTKITAPQPAVATSGVLDQVLGEFAQFGGPMVNAMNAGVQAASVLAQDTTPPYTAITPFFSDTGTVTFSPLFKSLFEHPASELRVIGAPNVSVVQLTITLDDGSTLKTDNLNVSDLNNFAFRLEGIKSITVRAVIDGKVSNDPLRIEAIGREALVSDQAKAEDKLISQTQTIDYVITTTQAVIDFTSDGRKVEAKGDIKTKVVLLPLGGGGSAGGSLGGGSSSSGGGVGGGGGGSFIGGGGGFSSGELRQPSNFTSPIGWDFEIAPPGNPEDGGPGIPETAIVMDNLGVGVYEKGIPLTLEAGTLAGVPAGSDVTIIGYDADGNVSFRINVKDAGNRIEFPIPIGTGRIRVEIRKDGKLIDTEDKILYLVPKKAPAKQNPQDAAEEIRPPMEQIERAAGLKLAVNPAVLSTPDLAEVPVSEQAVEGGTASENQVPVQTDGQTWLTTQQRIGLALASVVTVAALAAHVRGNQAQTKDEPALNADTQSRPNLNSPPEPLFLRPTPDLSGLYTALNPEEAGAQVVVVVAVPADQQVLFRFTRGFGANLQVVSESRSDASHRGVYTVNTPTERFDGFLVVRLDANGREIKTTATDIGRLAVDGMTLFGLRTGAPITTAPLQTQTALTMYEFLAIWELLTYQTFIDQYLPGRIRTLYPNGEAEIELFSGIRVRIKLISYPQPGGSPGRASIGSSGSVGSGNLVKPQERPQQELGYSIPYDFEVKDPGTPDQGPGLTPEGTLLFRKVEGQPGVYEAAIPVTLEAATIKAVPQGTNLVVTGYDAEGKEVWQQVIKNAGGDVQIEIQIATNKITVKMTNQAGKPVEIPNGQFRLVPKEGKKNQSGTLRERLPTVVDAGKSLVVPNNDVENAAVVAQPIEVGGQSVQTNGGQNGSSNEALTAAGLFVAGIVAVSVGSAKKKTEDKRTEATAGSAARRPSQPRVRRERVSNPTDENFINYYFVPDAAGRVTLSRDVSELSTPAGQRALLTRRGQRWLGTQDGRNFLASNRGPIFLTTPAGRRFLSSYEGGRWASTEAGRAWLGTPAGFAWLGTRAGSVWLTTPGHNWLPSADGLRLLQTDSGHRWLASNAAAGWLGSRMGHIFLAAAESNSFLSSRYGTQWLSGQIGQAWLGSLQGYSWLTSDAGRLWLESNEAADFRSSEAFLPYVSSGFGQAWLASEFGQRWLTDAANSTAEITADFREGPRFAQVLRTPAGLDWILSDAGLEWMASDSGLVWLNGEAGAAWMASDLTPLLGSSRGLTWLYLVFGDRLQKEFGENWFSRENRPMATWLANGNFARMLLEIYGEEWIAGNFEETSIDALFAAPQREAQAEQVKAVTALSFYGAMGMSAFALLSMGAYSPVDIGFAVVLTGVIAGIVVLVGVSWIVRWAIRAGRAARGDAPDAPKLSWGTRSILMMGISAITVLTGAALFAAPIVTLTVFAVAVLFVLLSAIFRPLGMILVPEVTRLLARHKSETLLALALGIVLAVFQADGIRRLALEADYGPVAAQVNGVNNGLPFDVTIKGPPGKNPGNYADVTGVRNVSIARKLTERRLQLGAPADTLPMDLMQSKTVTDRRDLLSKQLATMNVNGLPTASKGGGATDRVVFNYNLTLDARRLRGEGKTEAAAKLFIDGIRRNPHNHGGLVVSYLAVPGPVAPGRQPWEGHQAFEREVKSGEMLHTAMTALDLWADTPAGETRVELMNIAKSAADYVIAMMNPDSGEVRYGPSVRSPTAEYQVDLVRIAYALYLATGNNSYRAAFSASLDRLIRAHYDGRGFTADGNAVGADGYPADVPGWAMSMIGPDILAANGVDVHRLTADLGTIPGNLLLPEWSANRVNGLRWGIAWLNAQAAAATDPAQAATFRQESASAQSNLRSLLTLLYTLPVQSAENGGGMAYAYKLKSGAVDKFAASSWEPAIGVNLPFLNFGAPTGSNRAPMTYLLSIADGHDIVAGMRPSDGKLIDWSSLRAAAAIDLRALNGKAPMFERGAGATWQVEKADDNLRQAVALQKAARLLLQNDGDNGRRFIAGVEILPNGELGETFSSARVLGDRIRVYKIPYYGRLQGPATAAQRGAGMISFDAERGYMWTIDPGNSLILDQRLDGPEGNRVLTNPALIYEQNPSYAKRVLGRTILLGYIAGMVLEMPDNAMTGFMGTVIPRQSLLTDPGDRALAERVIREVELNWGADPRLSGYYSPASQERGLTYAAYLRRAWLQERVIGERHEDYPALREIRTRLEKETRGTPAHTQLLEDYRKAREVVWWMADQKAVLERALAKAKDISPEELALLGLPSMQPFGPAIAQALNEARTAPARARINAALKIVRHGQYDNFYVDPLNGSVVLVVGSDGVSRAKDALKRIEAEIVRLQADPAVNAARLADLASAKTLIARRIDWAMARGYADSRPGINNFEKAYLDMDQRTQDVWREISNPATNAGRRSVLIAELYRLSATMSWNSNKSSKTMYFGTGQALREYDAMHKADRGADPAHLGFNNLLGRPEVVNPTTLDTRYNIQEEVLAQGRYDKSALTVVRVTPGLQVAPHLAFRNVMGNIEGELRGEDIRIDGVPLESVRFPVTSGARLTGKNLVYVNLVNGQMPGRPFNVFESQSYAIPDGAAYGSVADFSLNLRTAIANKTITPSVTRRMNPSQPGVAYVETAMGRQWVEKYSVANWTDPNTWLVQILYPDGRDVVYTAHQFNRFNGAWTSGVASTFRNGWIEGRDTVTRLDQQRGTVRATTERFEGPWDIHGVFGGLIRAAFPNRAVSVGETIRSHDGLLVEQILPDRTLIISNDVALERTLRAIAGTAEEIDIARIAGVYENGASGKVAGTYEVRYTLGAKGEVTSLSVTRRSALPDGTASWETQSYDRAPLDARTPFGSPQGILRLRKNSVGVSVVGANNLSVDLTEREEEIFFDGDRNIPSVLDAAAKQANRPLNPAVQSEFGRIVYEVGPGGRRPMSWWINSGLELSDARAGTESTLLHIVEFWPGSFPRNHWIDRQGRDWRETKLGGQVSHNNNLFDLNRPAWTWISTGSSVAERLPVGFHTNGPVIDHTNAPSTTNNPGREVYAREFFPDAPAHMKLYEVKETPTDTTGDPKTQTNFSYYDGNGRLWAQIQGVDGAAIRSVSYYPQLGARRYDAPGANGEVAFSGDASKSDFVYFFAQGGNVDEFQVAVTDAQGNRVVLGREYFNSTHAGGLYSPEFSDPLVQIPAGTAEPAKGKGTFRFVAAQPMDGLGRLFSTGNQPRGIFLPVSFLKQMGIDTSTMKIALQGANGVTVTAAERAGDPSGIAQWTDSLTSRERFFPTGRGYEKIEPRAPAIVDQGNGIVTVRRGSGTREQIWVYDHNIPISLTYWQKSGEVYDQVRIQFYPSLSEHLRVPETQEAAFANWLSGVVSISQVRNGRIETIVGAAPPAVTRRLYPNGAVNFQNPVSIYLPFGFSDSDATMKNIAGNPVTSVALRLWPQLHDVVGQFGNDVFKVPPEMLGPIEIRSQLLGSRLNAPLSIDQRPLPVAATLPVGTPALTTKDAWADSLRWGSRLPMTHPGTERETIVDAADLARIVEGLAAAGRTDDAMRILSFIEETTVNGTTPLLLGYTIAGQAVQRNPEWNAPGVAVARAEPTVRMAYAMLQLSRALKNDPEAQARAWKLAVNLTRTTTRFSPDTDYLRSERPVAERASTLVGIYAGFVDPSQVGRPNRNEDFVRKTAAVGAILVEADAALKGSFPSAAAVRQKRAEFINRIIAVVAPGDAANAEKLIEVLRTTGGIVESLPTRPVLLPGPSIVLTPDADVYEPETHAEALRLYLAMEAEMSRSGTVGAGEEKFLSEVRFRLGTLNDWISFNMLPLLEEQNGLFSEHMREQPAIITASAGLPTLPPQAIAPSRTPTLRASLSMFEISLRLDPSDANRAKVRGWLERAMKLYGVNANGRSGFRYATATGHIIEPMSSELTARFLRISRLADYAPGVSFAEASLRGFVAADGQVVEGIPDVDGKIGRTGLETGDGRRLLPNQNGEVGVSPAATVEALRATTDIDQTDAVGRNARERTDQDLSRSTPDEQIKDLLRDANVQTASWLWVLASAFLYVVTFKRWGSASPSSYTYLALRLLRDLAFLPVLVAPAVLSVFMLSNLSLGITIAVVWMFMASKLMFAEGTHLIWSVFMVPKLKRWESLPPGQRMISEDIFNAHEDRFYKRVLGVYQVQRNGAPSDLWGQSVPRQLPPVDIGAHIGNGETLFVPGFQDIHLYAIEFYRRTHPDVDVGTLNAAALPSMNAPDSDGNVGDVPELQRLDRALRLAAEWLRKQLGKPDADVRYYAWSVFYFSQMAEQLRQILAAPQNADPGGLNKTLSPEQQARFNEILNRLVAKVDSIDTAPAQFQAEINDFAQRRNLNPIHPYWLSKFQFAPQMILFGISAAFVYAANVGSASPLSIIISNAAVFTPVLGTAIWILGAIGIAALLVSIMFYWNGRPMQERKFEFKFSPRVRAIASITFRSVLTVALIGGILAMVALTPGLNYQVGVHLLSPFGISLGVPNLPLDLVTILLPLVGSLVVLWEIAALWTAKVSFVGSMFRRHYHFSAQNANAQNNFWVFLQYSVWMVLGWWMFTEVAPFFQGFLGQVNTPLPFERPGFNVLNHIIMIGTFSLAAVWTWTQVLKLKPFEGKSTRAGIIKTVAVALLGLTLAVAMWHLGLPVDNPLRGLGLPIGLGNPLMSVLVGLPGTLVMAALTFRGYERPTRLQKILMIIIGVLLFGGMVLGIDLYRPIGGFMIGAMAFVAALTLSFVALYYASHGITSVADASGRSYNLVQIAVPMVGVGLISVSLPSLLSSLGIGIPFLTSISAFALPFLGGYEWMFAVAFYGLGLLFLAGSGHPAFSTLTISTGLVAIFAPLIAPTWGLIPYVNWLFVGLIVLSLIARAVRIARKRKEDSDIRNNNPANVRDGSVAIWVTGGNPLSPEAIRQNPNDGADSVDKAVKLYMKMFKEYLKPANIGSLSELLDTNGQLMDDAAIERALRTLFAAEQQKGFPLLAEGAISYPGQVLSPKNQLLQQRMAHIPVNDRIIDARFAAANLEQANLLALGFRLKTYIVERTSPGGSQWDTAVYLMSLAQAAAAAGYGKKIVLNVQSNKYTAGKPENQPGERGPRIAYDPSTNDNDVKNMWEFDNRIFLTRLAEAVTGGVVEINEVPEFQNNDPGAIAAEVGFNWTGAPTKSATQNMSNGSLRDIDVVLVLDRNAKTYMVRENVQDMIRMLLNPDAVGLFARRSAQNKFYGTERQGAAGEGGFTRDKESSIGSMGEGGAERVAIGWGMWVRMPQRNLRRAYLDPRFPDRFDPNVGWLGRLFGANRIPSNNPHISEDTKQLKGNAGGMKSLGGAPVMLVTRAFSFKDRELTTIAMPTARPRWAGGGEAGQMGYDIEWQVNDYWSTDSIFMMEQQMNRARYYSLAVLGMLNIVLTPLLVVAGYTPFAGILLLFWLVGMIANQVLTLNGLGAYIDQRGFWPGLSLWVIERFGDMILFSYLGFIELYGVLDATMKGKNFSYFFAISGGANIVPYSTNFWDYLTENPTYAHLFRWITMTGLFVTALNLFAVMNLDVLNVGMLYPSLIFSAGLGISPLVYQAWKGPGRSFMKLAWWWPKVAGILVAVASLILISIGGGGLKVGGLLQPLFQMAGLNAGTDALLFIAAAIVALIYGGSRARRSLRDTSAQVAGTTSPADKQKAVAPLIRAVGFASIVIALSIAGALLANGHISAFMLSFGMDPGLHILFPLGVALFLIFVPSRRLLLRVGEYVNAKDPGPKSAADAQRRFHNTWVVGLWFAATVAAFFIFLSLTGSLASASIISIPVFLKFLGLFVNPIQDWNQGIIGTPWNRVKTGDAAKGTKVVGTTAAPITQQYFWDMFLVAGMLTIVALIWIILVPSPGSVVARIPPFSVTINYLQLALFAVAGAGFVVATLVTGWVVYRVHWFLLERKYRRLKAWYEANKGNIDPTLWAMASDQLRGYLQAKDSGANIYAAERLRDLEKIRNNPNDPLAYLDIKPQGPPSTTPVTPRTPDQRPADVAPVVPVAPVVDQTPDASTLRGELAGMGRESRKRAATLRQRLGDLAGALDRHGKGGSSKFIPAILITLVMATGAMAGDGSAVAGMGIDLGFALFAIVAFVTIRFGRSILAFTLRGVASLLGGGEPAVKKSVVSATAALLSENADLKKRGADTARLWAVADKPASERTADDLRAAITALESLSQDRPLGVTFAFDRPSESSDLLNGQLDQVGKASLQSTLEGIYLKYTGKTGVAVDQAFRDMTREADVQKIVFTPAGRTVDEIVKEIARTEASARAASPDRRVQVEVRLGGEDATANEELAAAVSAVLAGRLGSSPIVVRGWSALPAATDAAAGELLSLENGTQARSIRVVVAQGATLPQNADVVLRSLGDRVAILMILSDGLQAVSLNLSEFLDMKKYALIASQA